MEEVRPRSPRRPSRLILGVLLLVALTLFVLWRSDNPRLSALRLTLIDLAAPTLRAVAGPSHALSSLLGDFRGASALRAENARLREELERLRGWRDAARRLEAENARLRALSATEPPAESPFVTAEVIGDAGGPFARSVIVNVGRDDGVADGAPALDARGLVGRVAGVAESAARVVLLTDPASRTPVHVGPDKLPAILAGDDGARPRLDFAQPLDAETAAALSGAQVTTSGDGGVLPRGLVVGHAASAEGDESVAGAERPAPRVDLAADLPRLFFLRIERRPIDRNALGAAELIRRFEPSDPLELGPDAVEAEDAGAEAQTPSDPETAADGETP